MLGYLFVMSILPLMSMIFSSFYLPDKRIFLLALFVYLYQYNKTVENKGVEPLTFPIQDRDNLAPIGYNP